MENAVLLNYSLEKSFEEMRISIATASDNLNDTIAQKEVNYRTGTFLHWLLDSYEYVTKIYGNLLSEQDTAFFSALRYANNKLKHDENVVLLYRCTGGFSFPVSFPFESEEIRFQWIPMPEETNEKYRNQHRNYRTCIEGREILPVAMRALKILEGRL